MTIRLSPQEIHRLCIVVGWRGEDAIEATTIALLSSGGDPATYLPTSAAETVTYRGLFGLSVRRDDPEDRMRLFDYRFNAREAFRRWVRNGRSWDGHVMMPIDRLVRERVRNGLESHESESDGRADRAG